jgi:hypothetical protein
MALNPNACYGQPRYVEAVEAPALKYGLFSVANFAPTGDPHWQQGVEWEPDLCGPALTYDCPTCVQNDGNTAPNKTYNDEGVPLEDASPFTVYGSFKCSPIGNWERAEQRAIRALETGEERAVETILAAGAHTGARALYGASTLDITPVAATPVSVQAGIALLEQYIGANGKGEGVIVGSRRDITLANTTGKLIYPEGDTLYTCLGTPVAALSGINGLIGPNNDAAEANEAWLWALGSRPRIWRGDVFLTSEKGASLDIQTNDLEILAERTYVLGWDCFTVGVLITTVSAV